MLFDLLRMGSMSSDARVQLIMGLLVRVFVIICVLPVHEFAHAFIANKLGDNTARLKGRLTLSPFAHIDPIGALMTLLCGFGYAKAVPVNIRNFRKKKKENTGNIYYFGDGTVFDAGHAKRCMAAVAVAGPVSNLIMAFISMFLMHIARFAFGSYLITHNDATVSLLASIVVIFFQICASININLAVFNLLPIPPLDGSRLISVILPDKIYFRIMQYERYIMLAILVLLFTGILTGPLSMLSNLVYNLMNDIVLLPFRLIIG